MRFTVITILPELIEPALAAGVVGRAREAGVIAVETVNPRDFTTDRHRTVDDTPYGGGPGMVMKAEPLLAAIAAGARGPAPDAALGGPDVRDDVSAAAQRPRPAHRILMTPAGAPLTQARVRELSALPHVVIVCGRYEGIDERVIELAIDEQLSIGDYVLSGGELAALVVIDAVARFVPGVLGEATSVDDESHSAGLLEYPQYTRPLKLVISSPGAAAPARAVAPENAAPLGVAELPGVGKPPGTVERPGTVEPLGAVERPGAVDPLGAVGSPGTVEPPGAVERPSITEPSPPGGQPADPGGSRKPVVHEVPAILTSGNHAAIAAWRRRQAIERTAQRRPDLFARFRPTPADRKLLPASPAPVHSRAHLALVHHPVVDRTGAVITTALTNFDIHDLARSSLTYGLAGYHIVTPITSQRDKAAHIAKLWIDDAQGEHRARALRLVRTAASIEAVIEALTVEHGISPMVVATSARGSSFPEIPRRSPSALLAEASANPAPLLVLLGTGWGLAEALIPSVSHMLAPIEGASEWNHLSVRSAGAVLLDRLFGGRFVGGSVG